MPIKTVSGTNIKADYAIAHEADYKVYGNSTQSATPTPLAPVAIQSVGDLVTNQSDENFGKYKIPIKTTNKNMFNPQRWFPNYVNDKHGITYSNTNFATIATVKILEKPV